MMLFKCGLLGIADVYCSTLSGSGVPLYSPWNFLLMQSIQDHCSDSLFTSLQSYVA